MLMNAFSNALAALHANADLAEDAVFYAGGAGPGVALRVIRQTAIDPAVASFGSMGSLRGKQLLDIQKTDLPDQPAPGDTIVIGATAYLVEAAETDEQRLTWRVTLSE